MIVSFRVNMSNSEHPLGSPGSKRVRRTFGPVLDVDLVWPPPAEELDACSVIHLDDSDARPPVNPDPALQTAVPPPLAPQVVAAPLRAAFGNDGRTAVKLAPGTDPRPVLKPTFGDCRAPGAAPRIQVMVVPLIPAEPPALPEPPPLPVSMVFAPLEPRPRLVRPVDLHALHAYLDLTRVDELVPFPLAGRSPISASLPDGANDSAVRSAWLALFVAASCALVTYSEFRAVQVPQEQTVALKSAPVLASPAAARPAPEPFAPAPLPKPEPTVIADARPAPPVPEVIATVAAKPSSHASAVDRGPVRRAEVAKPPVPLRAAAPARPMPPAVTVTVRDRGSVTGLAQPRISTPVRQDAPVAAAIASPAAAPAPAPALAFAPPTPVPLANAAPAKPVAAVLTDAVGDDEAHIRTTLTRFRTAYSQLNASAAREVWPSVDARALERAFQGLKSQDLRFDSCSLTVTGARAQAACKGRAVYVPRIGDQSPRRTSREWTFDLRKADEGWTIASARSL